MTGNEIYREALALLGQRPEENDLWDKLAPSWLNMVLAESHSAENSLRRFLGLNELSQPQRVKSLEEKLKYQNRLRTALVNGMASILWDEGHDRPKALDYRARFAAALAETEKVHPESVVDVYG
ncbi:MAG: hypothetical protein IIV90_07585 [Oscillospiraceae bacterium]|nr:hypothetical protein [Oscillospiraceae bacterium]